MPVNFPPSFSSQGWRLVIFGSPSRKTGYSVSFCSNEKWFVLHQAPNIQTNRYRAPAHLCNVIECKKAYGEKVIFRVRMMDEIILPVVWFEISVNSDVYILREGAEE